MNLLVSLPIVAAVPTASPAMPTNDPIFAAIERARQAKAQSDARYARVSKLYKSAAKRGLGEESSLDERNAFVEAKFGCDPDIYTDETAQALWDAVDETFEVVPTTPAGMLALLRFADKLGERESDLVLENAFTLIATLTAAAERQLSGSGTST
ncbi:MULTISPECIES: hypothetical protein [Bradyrhizobium]|jgi:hypothetical protein|uniref:Uncharacterized protein n=2 Tax=Bradyrhizobium TaxID=374 RepID=A0ABY0QF74_9BRAD|nr:MULTISPECIES: hypothetical protein [Bradyrhizobium]SDK14073.1 hypothetical protein SAMN05444163_7339 [Bradyrhizobium ottawaense]SEE51070.1 hypothetical protein SAMN05444171_7792 [Bradyrhizobium lablabi]SHM51466.1 hypothetical protein SAMN05444321_6593 [Bradyrhizobium lablabi]